MLVAVVSSAATAVVPGRRGAASCATATSGVTVAAEAAWDIRRTSSASSSTLQQSSQAFRHRSVVAQSRRALSSSSSLRGIEMGVKRSLGARQTHKRLLSSSIRSQAAGLFPPRLSHVCLSFLGNPSSFCICSSVSLLGFCVLSTATRVSIPFCTSVFGDRVFGLQETQVSAGVVPLQLEKHLSNLGMLSFVMRGA
jgi:hypothetical protein